MMKEIEVIIAYFYIYIIYSIYPLYSKITNVGENILIFDTEHYC